MKQTHGWWWPDHELHMIGWMDSPKNRLKLNGRWTYQGAKQQLVLEHCPPGRRRTAVDVGAHVGLWAWNLAHAFERVHAFEPVAAHRECFAANVALDNVALIPVALGAHAGSVAMCTEKGSSGNTQVAGAGDVPMHTLDSYGFDAVDLIKIDCEGYEENVVRGGAETIARCRPTVIVEQKRDMATRFGLKSQGAVELLRSLGYRVAREYSGDFIMVC